MRALALLACTFFVAFSHAADDAAEARRAGDRFVAGGSVRQASAVEGDLFGAAGTFELDASVGGSASLAGGSVVIGPDASIAGRLSAATGTIEIRGPVRGSVHVAGGHVLVDSKVDGDVRVAAGELRLGPNARIGGRLRHRAQDLQVDPQAQVAGGIERGERMRPETGRGAHAWRWGGFAWTLGLVALAALIAGAFPLGSRRVGESLRGEPAVAVLVGFMVLVCVPVAALLLLVTIIGIPLAVALLLLYFLVLLVGYATIAVVLGDAALARLRAQDAQRTGWRMGAAMAAMLALAILTRIPWVGGLVAFAVLLAGLGAIVLATRAWREAARGDTRPA